MSNNVTPTFNGYSLQDKADSCFEFLSGDKKSGNTAELIQKTDEWGIDNVFALKINTMTNLTSKNATNYQYELRKMCYHTDSDRSTVKNTITLHYTAGWGNIWGLDHLAIARYNADKANLSSGEPELHCVPFWVNTDGRIYQLYHPDYWSYSSHLSPYEKTNVAIEIVNIGLLKTGNDPNILYFSDSDNSKYCKLSDTHLYYDLERDMPYGKSIFKGKRYFAKYTDEQYIALTKLLKALSVRYNIPYQFLPIEDRFLHAKEFNNKENKIEVGKYSYTNFKGIITHVNNAESGKWDIGPAFDWEQISGNQVCYPFEPDNRIISTPSVQWYANTETRRQGGYFPVGINRSFHSGVHLFSNKQTQEVKSMAPGYVVAFRFFTKDGYKYVSRLVDTTKIKLHHIKTTSFVLIRHESIFEGEKTARSYYSLYMDMESPNESDMERIPWLDKVKRYALGSEIHFGYEDAGKTNRFNEVQANYGDTHIHPLAQFEDLDFSDANKVQVRVGTQRYPEKVVTVSEPLLYVEAGEIIGYTKMDGTEGNYLHWEVFTDNEETLKKVISQSKVSNISYEDMTSSAEDGIYTDDELKQLFDIKELTSYGLDGEDGKKKNIETIIAEHYCGGSEYDITMKLNLPAGVTLKQGTNITIEAHGGGEKLCFSNPSTGKIIISIPTTGETKPTSLGVSVKSWSEKAYTLTIPKIADKLVLTLHNGMNVYFSVGKQQELLKNQIMKKKIFRNATVTSISPWSTKYWEETVKKLGTLGAASQELAFEKEAFAPYIIFEKDTEHPLYDSVFSGGALLDPGKKYTYINPVTFSWLLLSPGADILTYNKPVLQPKENTLKRYCFIRKKNTEASPPKTAANVTMGEAMKVIIIAEEERLGLPNPAVIPLPGQTLEVNLNDKGLYIAEIDTNRWGTYTLEPDIKAIEGQTAQYTIETPSLGAARLDWDTGKEGLEGKLVIPYTKHLPKDAYLIMKFRTKIEGKPGSAEKEADNGLMLIITKNETTPELTSSKFSMQGIFDTIEPLKDEEHLVMKYTAVIYNCAKEALFNRLIDKDTIDTSKIQSGSYLINVQQVEYDYIETSSGYQQMNLAAVAPAFDGSPIGFTTQQGKDTADKRFRIGNGVTFLPEVNLTEDMKKNIGNYYRAIIQIESGSETITIGQAKAPIGEVVLKGRTLLCLLTPLESYFTGTKDICIGFINKKGINYIYETKARIVNPITSVQATYETGTTMGASKVVLVVSLEETAFPQWCSKCDVSLDWYYHDNPETTPGPDKIWTKKITNKDVKNNELKVEVPFTEIRGNSFGIKIHPVGGGGTIIGNCPRVIITGMPDNHKTVFDNLKPINNIGTNDAVKARKNPGKDSEYYTIGNSTQPFTFATGTNVFILFNNEGKYISQTVLESGKNVIYLKTEGIVNNEKKISWVYNSRLIN